MKHGLRLMVFTLELSAIEIFLENDIGLYLSTESPGTILTKTGLENSCFAGEVIAPTKLINIARII